jgi:hypothetical protein
MRAVSPPLEWPRLNGVSALQRAGAMSTLAGDSTHCLGHPKLSHFRLYAAPPGPGCARAETVALVRHQGRVTFRGCPAPPTSRTKIFVSASQVRKKTPSLQSLFGFSVVLGAGVGGWLRLPPPGGLG